MAKGVDGRIMTIINWLRFMFGSYDGVFLPFRRCKFCEERALFKIKKKKDIPGHVECKSCWMLNEVDG